MTTSNESNSGFGLSKEEAILPRAAKESDLEDIDKDWIKEIYFPDLQNGESPTEFLLKVQFESAGYRVKRLETAPTHPVIIIHAVRITAPRIAVNKMLFGHIREVLSRVGFRLKRDELTVDQKGCRILVAFPSGQPQTHFSRILEEPQQD